MSETIQNTSNSTVGAEQTTTETKPVKVEMTAEEYQKWERNVQLGITDELPDGRKLKEVQKEYADEQLRQQEERRLGATLRKDETPDDAAKKPVEAAPETPLEVTIHANGAVSATPKIDEKIEENSAPQNGDGEPENDIPGDFPGRKALIAAGHLSLETIAKFTLDDLVNISGIKQPTAEKILNYGKSV